MDKRFKNNGFSMIRPVSMDKPIENCDLSIEFQFLVEKPCCDASRGKSGLVGNGLSTVQSIEKQYFC